MFLSLVDVSGIFDALLSFELSPLGSIRSASLHLGFQRGRSSDAHWYDN